MKLFYQELMIAIQVNDFEFVKKYIEDGKNINFYTIKDSRYDNSCPCLIHYDPEISVRQFYENAKIEHAKLVGSYRWRLREFTPLSYACFLNHDEIVRLLVEHGANINVFDKDCGNSSSKHIFSSNWQFDQSSSVYFQPLWWACFHKNNQLVYYLLEHGADITLCNSHDNFDGFIEFACEMGNVEVVDKLLSNGCVADMDQLILFACSNYDHDMIRILINYGVTIIHHCIVQLEQLYIKKNWKGRYEILIFDLLLIYHYRDMNYFIENDFANKLSYEYHELETIALLLLHYNKSYETIYCPTIMEWVKEIMIRFEKERIIKRTKIIEEELLQTSLHPDRIDWFLDHEQRAAWYGTF